MFLEYQNRMWQTVEIDHRDFFRLNIFIISLIQVKQCVYIYQFSSVQSFSPVPLFVTSWTAACQASLSIAGELAQTPVHWVGDAIQPSQPLSSPSPPAFSISQPQGFFQWVSSSHQVTKVLELQLEHQSFQWIFRTDLLQDGLVGSPCSPRNSQESSPTPQFKSINSLVLSFLYGPTLLYTHTHLPWGLSGKKFACQCRSSKRSGFSPWDGKSPGRGNGHPLQYSCLENSRGAWQAEVHGVAKSGTEHTCTQSSLITRASRVILSSSLTV